MADSTDTVNADPSGLREFAPVAVDHLMSNPVLAEQIADRIGHIAQVEAGVRGTDPDQTRFLNPDGKPLMTKAEAVKQFLRDKVHEMVMLALDTKDAYRASRKQSQLNETRAKQVMGNPVTKDEAAFADKLSEEMRAFPFESRFHDEGGVAGFFHELPAETGKLAGTLQHEAPVIMGYAAGGAAAGSLYGAGVGSLAGGVGAGPGALAGAVSWGGKGLAVGMGTAFGIQAMGGFYDQMKYATLADGQPVPDDVAKGASIVLGLVNGALGVLPVGSLLSKTPMVQRLAGAGGAEFMRRLLVQPGVAGVLKRAAVATSASEALNIGISVLQDLSSYSAEKFVTQGASDDYSLERFGKSVRSGAQLGFVFGGPELVKGEIMRPSEIAARAQDAATAVANYSNLGSLHEIPLFMQDKMQLRDFVQRLAEQNKLPDVTLPREKLVAYLKDIGLADKDLEAALPEVAKQLKESLNDPGAEIRLTPAEVATYLAGNKGFDTLKGDLRSGNNYTLNEIAKLSKASEKGLKMPEATEMDKNLRPVFDDVFGQTRKATKDSASAELAATLYTSAVRSLAEATGAKPEEIHQEWGLKVVKKLAATLDEHAAGIPGETVADVSRYNIAKFGDAVPGSLQPWLNDLREHAATINKNVPKKSGAWDEAFGLLRITTGSPMDAANVLAGLGYDGVHTGERNIVWRPDITLPTRDPLTVTRGATDFKTGRTTVALTEHGNIAAVAHEFAHVFLRMWDKAAGDSPEMSKLKKWLGAEAGKLSVEHEEKFARAFIDNLKSGTLGNLSPAFSKFSTWLSALYKAETALGAPVPKEISLVMDKMLAVNEAVTTARQQLARPMFDSAAKAGMTEEQFKRYQSMMEMAVATEQNALNRELLSRMNDDGIAAFEAMKSTVRGEMVATDSRHSLVSFIKDGKRLDDGPMPVAADPGHVVEGFRVEAASELGVPLKENGDGAKVQLVVHQPFEMHQEQLTTLLKDEIPSARNQVLKDFRQALASQGYDSIRVEQSDGSARWFVFNPKTELKSFKLDTASLKQAGADPMTMARMEVLGMHGPDGVLNINDVARAFGFRDGSEAVDAFRTYQPLDAAVAQEAAKRMPGWVDPRSWLAGRAMDKLSGDAIPRMLHIELGAITGKLGDFERDINSVRAIARRDISKQQVASLTPQHLLREYFRLGEEAQKALSSGDKPTAQELKAKQLLAFEGWRAARDAMEDASRFSERAVQLRDDSQTRERLSRAGSGHMAAIDAALAAYGLGDKTKVPRDFNISKYLEEQYHADIITDPNLEGRTDSAVQVHDFTVRDLRTAHRFLDSLVNHIEQVDEFRAGPTPKLLDAAVTRLVEHIKTNRETIQRELRNQVAEFIKTGLRKGASELMRAEFLMKILDGGDPHGLLAQALFQPIAEASAKKTVMHGAVRDTLADIIEQYKKSDTRNRLDEMTDFHVRDRDVLNKVTGKMEPVNGTRIRKSELLTLLLNYGTPLNREAVTKGYRIGHDELVAAFERNLTRADIEFASRVWQTMDAVLPEVAKTFQKRSGVALEAVAPASLTLNLADGPVDIKGGYFPIKMSADATLTRALRGDFTTAEMEHSFTYSRHGSFGPVDLNLASTVSHLQRKVHYASMYDAVQEVRKVIMHPDFIKTVKDTVGQEYHKTLTDWLTNITREGLSPELVGFWDRVVKHVMSGVAQAALGLNSKTAYMQTIGLFPVLKNVDSKHLASALGDVMSNWHETLKNAEVQSSELRHIGVNLADARWKVLVPDFTVPVTVEAQMQSLGRGKIFGSATEVRDFLQQLGMTHIAAVQKFVNVVTFEAAKRQAIAESRPDPIAYADAIIRQTQGGADLKDLPAIMARPGMARSEIMFYSYMSVLANEALETGYSFAGSKGSTKAAILALAGSAAFYFLMPNTAQFMVDQKYKDKPARSGISDAEWFLRAQLALSSARMLPVLGDVAGAVVAPDAPGHGFGPLGQFSGSVRNIMSSAIRPGQKFNGEAVSVAMSVAQKVPAHHLYQGLELMYLAADGRLSSPEKAWSVYIRGPKKEGLKR